MRFSFSFANKNTIVMYAVLLSLLMLGDGVMSYIAPSIIEEHVLNPFVMGIVIAFSSFVGFICDLMFASRFRGNRFGFIFKRSLLAAVLFPIVFLLFGNHVLAFLLAMGIWGLYYELMTFSNFHFVEDYVSVHNHTTVWGILGSVWSLSWFVAPFLASYIYDRWESGPLVLAAVFYATALFGFLVTSVFWKKKEQEVIDHEHAQYKEENITNKQTSVELKIWWQLLRKIWPVYAFSFYITIISSGFWTVGTLLSEELRKDSLWGVFFFSAWTFPPLIFSLLSGEVASKLRKKRTAFLSGFLSGLMLIPLIWFHTAPIIVMLTFVSAAFYSLGYPALDASVQEYVKKLGKVGNDLIGLQSSATSSAYILGPILAGFLATIFGNRVTLGVLGIGFSLISLLCLVVVRREIRLPHEALHEIISEAKE